MNTSQTGDVSEGLVLSYFLRQGYTVSVPFGTASYDLVLDREGLLYRIQCKTAWEENGRLAFNGCSTDRRTGKRQSYQGLADAVVVYYPVLDKFYWIPLEEIPKSGVMTLRTEPTSNGQAKGIRWAHDFEMQP